MHLSAFIMVRHGVAGSAMETQTDQEYPVYTATPDRCRCISSYELQKGTAITQGWCADEKRRLYMIALESFSQQLTSVEILPVWFRNCRVSQENFEDQRVFCNYPETLLSFAHCVW